MEKKEINANVSKTLEVLIDCTYKNWWCDIGHASFLHLYNTVQLLSKEYDVKNYDKLFLYYSRSDKKRFLEVYETMKVL